MNFLKDQVISVEEWIEEVGKKGLRSIAAAFSIIAFYLLMGAMSPELSAKSGAIINDFVIHSIDARFTLLNMVVFLGGGALCIIGAKIVSFLVDWVIRPILDFLYHSMTIAIGGVVGYIFSMIFIVDFRKDLLSAAGFLLLMMAVVAVTILLLFIAENNRIKELIELKEKVGSKIVVAGALVIGGVMLVTSWKAVSDEVRKYDVHVNGQKCDKEK